MQQPRTKIYNGPYRFSSRQRIFDSSTQPAQHSHDSDMMRMMAKVRQLEDDLNSMINRNTEIESQNTELVKMIEQLDFGIESQQIQISNLMNGIARQMQASSGIDRYQQDLKAVSGQIIRLHETIRFKNQNYQRIREQREQAQYKNRKLKQQSNILLFNQNIMQQQFTAIYQDQYESSSGSRQQNLQQIIKILIEQCQSLSQQINSKQQHIQRAKKQNNQALMIQKQKRIKLQFEMRLLRERKSDFDKKKSFFESCYNEKATQDVIDDMLKKQDSIRQLIDEQQQIKKALLQEYDGIMQEQHKMVNRQRNHKLQQIKMIETEIEILKGELNNHNYRLSEIERRFTTVDQETKMQEYLVVLGDQTLRKVKSIQQENMQLQKTKSQLSSQIQFLKRQLSS